MSHPDDPLKGPEPPDPVAQDDGFENTVWTIIAIVAALLLVAFVVGVPTEVGQGTTSPAGS